MNDSAPNEPVLPQIKTIVCLMLENRSLDSMLGWLYRDAPPKHVFPGGSNPRFDGIPAGASNTYRGKSYTPAYGTGAMHQPCRVPRWDPNESFEHVVLQLYGDGEGRLPVVTWPNPPPMTGFAFDYDEFYTANIEIMGAYDATQLPILYGLAEAFAVSDRWFASVPTQTNANRAFSLCGTSLGGVDNGTPKFFDTKTLFNALSGRKSWGIYFQYDGVSSGDPDPSADGCFTADIFPQIRGAIARGEGTLQPYARFLAALEAGEDLPEFCYIEPYWGGGKGYPTGEDFVGVQGNDYHPPAWIGPAEASLNDLYEALRKSKQWPNLLFVVLFDEHGGTWDHVSPPRTVAPDSHTSTFDFTRLGVRVPAILVSPFVVPGAVFRAPFGSAYDLDHTSLVATVLKWAGIEPSAAGLGARVASAPTFEGIFSATPFDNAPSFSVPEGYREQGGGLGFHLLDVESRTVSIADIRAAHGATTSIDDFKSRLRALALERSP